MNRNVETGLDRVARGLPKRLRGARLGIVAHQASVDRSLRHILGVFAGLGTDLRAVFAPEHGISGTEQDLQPVSHGQAGSVPVFSLYGERLGPAPAMLEGLDFLIFDLQDVGSRYYTYISTMLHCMRACASTAVGFVVLDRPNPIGGDVVEGNIIEPTHLSYVGIHPLPARHGMTVGEIAKMMQSELSLDVDLTIVPLTGWRRRCWLDQTGLPWVLPSPNMPTLDTATVYPGMCLLEGTILSEGRGTTRPFEIFGAPWLDGRGFADFLGTCRLPGVVFRPLQFKPTFNKYAGDVCQGFQIHVTDRMRFKPYLTGLAIVQGGILLHRGRLAWRQPPYEFETEKLPIDILLGSTAVRLRIERGDTVREIERGWSRELVSFGRRRARFLLY
ncbi:MAG: DUF1343 domain-containing protein [Acidobacteria bacterium]|nr:DUF1343 domain-containing protein [Acidobacteriota bacterium]